MPNRILRDWTDSYHVEPLSAEAERLFVRLIMKADDFGRFHADPRLIKAACFPLLSVRDTDISLWIAECEKSGVIAVYAVDGRKYLAVIDFKQRMRESKSKFPTKPGEELDWCPTRAVPMSDTGQSNDGQLPARVANTHTSPPSSPSPPNARAPVRLHGIPSSPEEVVAYGATLNPVVIPETCQGFFAHYEGQARTNANGEVFWITSGQAVVTNWKAKLPSFHGNGGTNGKGRPATITELKAIIQVKEEKAKALRDRYASEGPMAVEWNNQSKRTEWSALRTEIKGLKERIEKMA